MFILIAVNVFVVDFKVVVFEFGLSINCLFLLGFGWKFRYTKKNKSFNSKIILG